MPPAAKEERLGTPQTPAEGLASPCTPCFTLAELATVARVLEAPGLHRGLPSAG